MWEKFSWQLLKRNLWSLITAFKWNGNFAKIFLIYHIKSVHYNKQWLTQTLLKPTMSFNKGQQIKFNCVVMTWMQHFRNVKHVAEIQFCLQLGTRSLLYMWQCISLTHARMKKSFPSIFCDAGIDAVRAQFLAHWTLLGVATITPELVWKRSEMTERWTWNNFRVDEPKEPWCVLVSSPFHEFINEMYFFHGIIWKTWSYN